VTVFTVKTATKSKLLLFQKKPCLSLLTTFTQAIFLKDTYAVKKQVVLKNDTTFATVTTKLANVSSKKLCIQLRAFKKCLNIVDNQPVEAAKLVNKIEELFLPK
jgi:hypothetical protein